jgi:hypothetical protein
MRTFFNNLMTRITLNGMRSIPYKTGQALKIIKHSDRFPLQVKKR